MAALQKFKLLATQCGVAESPTRSPRTSPIVHLPRRKTTLRMLLTRGGSSGRRSPRRRHSADDARLRAAVPSPPQPIIEKRNTLKDLFVSSSPEDLKDDDGEFEERGVAGFGGGGWRAGSGSPRPGFLRLRYRYLLRKGWRPVLSSIPEEILAEIS